MRIEAEMRLGRHRELVSELKVLVFNHPLDERFHGNLMTALSRSGRRCEALDVYRRLRAVLIEELGLEPSAPLQRLHQSLLSGDLVGPGGDAQTELIAAGYLPPVTATYMSSLTVPAQLPPDVPDFTGRTACLSRVRHELAVRRDGATTARAVSICGTPGAGKTTLALHAAHMDRAKYPEGQLFANLRSTSAAQADPTDVLADFLQAVGLPKYQIPATLEERAKLFRTWSNGRRALIVLDDAYSASQVASLLPATPECAVIITSRWRLNGLPGVETLELGVRDLSEGVELLSRIIGASKVTTARKQVERIVDLCGYLPLALRSIGARLAAMPSWQPQKIAAQLESDTARLDQLRFAELDVRAGYDGSYYRLDPCDRSAFRLLSLLPPRDFSVATAASLLGSTAEAVEAQLTRLVGCHLLEAKVENGTGDARYRLHKLIRLYAQERLNREVIQPEASG
jgi:predicted ATPase